MNWDAHLRMRHLRCFLEIARGESVSQAAEALHLTQPAVSRTLKELEGMLGTQLFDRVGRGIRLNAAGRVFQNHASASMIELIRGRDRLARDAAQNSRLSIGVLPTAAAELVPKAALAFHRAAPHVRLHILTGPNWLLFNQLRDGALDLVVGRMPEGQVATGVTFEQLYIEDVVLACRPDHPILSSGAPEAMLLDYPMITPPKGAVIAATVDRYLGSIGLPEMHGMFETVALPIGRKILQTSDALWFISRGVVADEAEHLECVEQGALVAVALGSPLLSGPVGISIARSAQLNVERKLFAECVRKAVE